MGERVYVGSCSGTLFALDRRDGRLSWSHDVRPLGRPTSFHGDPLIADSLLVIGTDGGTQENSRSDIWAFDLDAGAVRWKHTASHGIVSDIVRAGARLLAITRDGSLVCLDLAGGGLVWRFAGDSTETEFMYRSPAAAGDRAFFAANRTLLALDLASGREVWKRTFEAPISTGILVRGDELLLAAADHDLHRVHAATGETRGRVPLGGTFLGPPVPIGDSLVVLARDRSVVCVNPAAGRVRWERTLPNEISASRPYLWRGSVLTATVRGEVFAFRAIDGLPQWSHTFTGVIRGIGQDERALYLGNQEGTVCAYPRTR